jgi:hypothetical protein
LEQAAERMVRDRATLEDKRWERFVFIAKSPLVLAVSRAIELAAEGLVARSTGHLRESNEVGISSFQPIRSLAQGPYAGNPARMRISMLSDLLAGARNCH